MKWFVLSITVTSTFARRRLFAAATPAKPPPIMTIRGPILSGNSLLERSGGQRHHQNKKYEQDTVCGRSSEGESAELSENLHRNRPVRMRVQNDARDELSNRGNRGEQTACDQPRPCCRNDDAAHRHPPRSAEPAGGIFERRVHLA